MISDFKNEVNLFLFLLLYIGPYLFLFYKRVNLRLRLLFVSVGEIVIVLIMIAINYFEKDNLVETIFFYSQFAFLSIILNLIIISLSWIFKKSE